MVCCRWEAKVFLNGKPVGSNLGASPFVLDVTDAAKPGAENELLIVATAQTRMAAEQRVRQVSKLGRLAGWNSA